ncbi:type II secretion system F family protein [Paenibacillus solisilvae]|uniref:Type II secretion system F family protein n=1 Tax=Paenibacillus solisilvae TaxID=2486751 RepID=A0ABW0VVX8_9BACL
MAILIGALLTIVWIAGFTINERSQARQKVIKTGDEKLDHPTVRRLLIIPMLWVLEKSGLLDRMQPFLSALHGKMFVLHGATWTVDATKQFAVFTIGCGYAAAACGAWLSLLSGERSLLYMGLLLGVIIPAARWRDTIRKFEQRKQDILLVIPEVMSKLMLLLGAGETVQRALIRCAERRDDRDKREIPLLIELRRANEEIRNGQSFSAAMEAFSRRCAVQEVSLFTTTILLNYRRGGDRLVLSLKELSYSLWEKRKAVARSRGEEASSKLVFPLVGIF